MIGRPFLGANSPKKTMTMARIWCNRGVCIGINEIATTRKLFEDTFTATIYMQKELLRHSGDLNALQLQHSPDILASDNITENTTIIPETRQTQISWTSLRSFRRDATFCFTLRRCRLTINRI